MTRNHAKVDAAWIKFAKKASKKKSVSYVEAREIAIRWGWIDGLKNRFDDDYYVLRFTPRRKRSRWSQINREIAETLIAEGRMEGPGMEQVEAARADGRWEKAYPPQSKMEVPEDLRAALARSKKAEKFFPTISRANRFSILYGIHDAKTGATRKKRIDKYVEMLAKHEVPHPEQ